MFLWSLFLKPVLSEHTRADTFPLNILGACRLLSCTTKIWVLFVNLIQTGHFYLRCFNFSSCHGVPHCPFVLVCSSRAESRCSQRQQKVLNSALHRLSENLKELQQENSILREELNTESPAGGLKGAFLNKSDNTLIIFLQKILQINTRAAIRSDAPMRCWTLSCLLGYREWSKQRLLRRLLEVETVREIVTNCPCKHRLSDFEELSRPWRLLSPPIRGWRTAADTPTQPNAEADWSRGSRPCPLRCRGLPWQQRQCSPWERWLRKWRRSLAWKTFLANWRRRGQSFNKHCHIKSEQAATLIIIH